MKIAVLGTGNMGRAIIDGLLRKYENTVTITAYDLRPAALHNLDKRVDVAEPQQWVQMDAIIVSVKPSDIFDALLALKPLFEKSDFNPLVISIAAGISIGTIQQQFSSVVRVCRVMPNTPAMIGEGMSACALAQNCNENDHTLCKNIFGACGKVFVVPENLINGVTGLSGSGPAYVYFFIEALAEGGVAAGLSHDAAMKSAVQTVIGAARMVEATKEDPSVLISKVMSPGGTTERGMAVLEQKGFKEIVRSAVDAAVRRAQELSARG